MNVHFFIKGMSCASCAQRIEKALCALPGIVSVTVKVELRFVDIEFDPTQIDQLRIRRQLATAGFKATDTAQKEDPPPKTGLKRFLGQCLFNVCENVPSLKAWFGQLGLRTDYEWFVNRTATIQLPGGESLNLASVGCNYLSFQLFWRGTGYYEPITTMVLQELLRPGDTFIDVGANIGFYPLVLSRTRPGLNVIAFEPNPWNQGLLEANIAVNGYNKIVCEPLALTDRDGTALLFLAQSDMSASLRSDFEDFKAESIEVQTITLDSYLASHRTEGKIVLKIDVEGNEEAVLRGAQHTITSIKPDIVLEIAMTHRSNPVSFLRDLGYRYFQITDKGLIESNELRPVIRGNLFFLNHLLSIKPSHEVEALFQRIQPGLQSIDFTKTSKCVESELIERALRRNAESASQEDFSIPNQSP